jgi:hypothetical protein
MALRKILQRHGGAIHICGISNRMSRSSPEPTLLEKELEHLVIYDSFSDALYDILPRFEKLKTVLLVEVSFRKSTHIIPELMAFLEKAAERRGAEVNAPIKFTFFSLKDLNKTYGVRRKTFGKPSPYNISKHQLTDNKR